MLDRLRRIRRVFGTWAYIKTLIMLTGVVVLPVAEVIGFRRPWGILIAAAGLWAGWLAREFIVARAEMLFRAAAIGFFLSGIALFIGERMGLGHEGKLLALLATFVIFFDIQFWSLSDPSIIKQED